MYCVFMSQEHLEDEDPRELYGEFIDEEYNWKHDDSTPGFLQDERETDVDLLTGGGSR